MTELVGANGVCPRRAESGADPTVHKIPAYDTWRDDRTCSWCGSLHPDDFITLLVQGNEIIPTDKTYKAYIQPGHKKFYYQHLSTEQMHRFVELVNKRVMNIGHPGHFYRLPYFMIVDEKKP